MGKIRFLGGDRAVRGMPQSDGTSNKRGAIVSDQLELAEAVRAACLRAVLDAYENAGISGLCGEGRWEMAIQELRNLDLRPVVDEHRRALGHVPEPPD